MRQYRTLTYLDWGLIGVLTVVAVLWQLSIGNSFTSRATSAILAGGLSLAISMRLARRYRER
jgi:hypothetical protein